MTASQPTAGLIEALVARYCAITTSVNAPRGEVTPQPRTPALMGGHTAEAFIDGVAYFSAIEDEIDKLLSSNAPGRFFYMTSWWLELLTVDAPISITASVAVPGSAPVWQFDLSTTAMILPKSRATLLSRLVALKQRQVEIRVLAWVSPFISVQAVAESTGIGAVNFASLQSIEQLRIQLNQDECAMPNLLSHTFGAAHCKLVICGDDRHVVGFTSGLDPQHDRLTPPHPAGGWHDLGVRVEGLAAGAIHGFFRDMWNEQLKRPPVTFTIDTIPIVSHNQGWAALPSRIWNIPATVPGRRYQHVQVLRTVPQMNFNQAGWDRRGKLLQPDLPRYKRLVLGKLANKFVQRPPISFAPNGIFEFKVALEKAIASAERYIFMIDQGFWSQEVMDWIHKRMAIKKQLKVIFVHGADPHDTPENYQIEAIANHLLGSAKQRSEINPKNIAFYTWENTAAHAKATIIDDVWCAIGSANSMRRSLYTDIELSVCILEAPTPENLLPASFAEEAQPDQFQKQSPSFVQKLRRDLWLHYCDPAQPPAARRAARTQLLRLDPALKLWDSTWGAGRGWETLGNKMHRIALEKFVTDPDDPFVQIAYDIKDADSRHPF